ncbi:hypothetical protein Adi01nite_34970 [Amorphoplanes digitatis]|nr:hypothetical protein GCM10020092_071700 [Actinoplanes digitatis]GID94085.1 hypothetical protein Adi01nite_34970 [Actinoplanes digitatis]
MSSHYYGVRLITKPFITLRSLPISWHDRKWIGKDKRRALRDNKSMRQLQFFTTSELAAMRDRTASRNYSPERDEFRRTHERHRAWGLTQRHARRLHQLRDQPEKHAATGPDEQHPKNPQPTHPARLVHAEPTRRPAPDRTTATHHNRSQLPSQQNSNHTASARTEPAEAHQHSKATGQAKPTAHHPPNQTTGQMQPAQTHPGPPALCPDGTCPEASVERTRQPRQIRAQMPVERTRQPRQIRAQMPGGRTRQPSQIRAQMPGGRAQPPGETRGPAPAAIPAPAGQATPGRRQQPDPRGRATPAETRQRATSNHRDSHPSRQSSEYQISTTPAIPNPHLAQSYGENPPSHSCTWSICGGPADAFSTA